MTDQNRAYDPDEYFGRAVDPVGPDLKAEAKRRLDSAIGYALLHAPDLVPSKADALALWAYRVHVVAARMTGFYGGPYADETLMIAAAEALAPKLGDKCPRRPV